MAREVRRYPNLDEMSRDAAAEVCAYARQCFREDDRFALALAGGRSPERLYRRLGSPPCDIGIPWSRVHWFLGDERCVPRTHPDSNYHLACQTIFSRVTPPPEHVHCPPADAGTPDAAAVRWEEELRRAFPPDRLADGFPVFDLILLGLGGDGHTASLFPGDPVLEEQGAWVRAVAPQGQPPVARLTLTLPVINRARRVVFLVSGKGKQKVLQRILAAPADPTSPFPAGRVDPAGRVMWFLDGAYV